jgi:hypothetical protein
MSMMEADEGDIADTVTGLEIGVTTGGEARMGADTEARTGTIGGEDIIDS